MKQTNDLHISEIKPLIPPIELKKEFPMTEISNKTVVEGRETVINILNKKTTGLWQ